MCSSPTSQPNSECVDIQLFPSHKADISSITQDKESQFNHTKNFSFARVLSSGQVEYITNHVNPRGDLDRENFNNT